ncbi:MAG: Type 1 glutamine amidotransferase-like domain-containing protein, partial [Patescibacteria group bacterium]|nr:Type 1 glutamine amidotransferase-like domain-containing protein [Patescibacteria group bacterium]
MKLFLTSSVHAVAHDIAKRVDLSREKELVFIDTAAEPEEGDKAWLTNDRQSLAAAGFSVTDYTITGKSRDELERDLEKFDYLYLSGGNTSYLLEQSRTSGFFSLV